MLDRENVYFRKTYIKNELWLWLVFVVKRKPAVRILEQLVV